MVVSRKKYHRLHLPRLSYGYQSASGICLFFRYDEDDQHMPHPIIASPPLILGATRKQDDWVLRYHEGHCYHFVPFPWTLANNRRQYREVVGW